MIINRRVAEADKVILAGTIGYHCLAGFGGGRKSILPGVASFESCVAPHFLVLDPEGGGRHPWARTGVLQGNPLHEDMMEAARLVPPKFLMQSFHLIMVYLIERLDIGRKLFPKDVILLIGNLRTSVTQTTDHKQQTMDTAYAKEKNHSEAHEDCW